MREFSPVPTCPHRCSFSDRPGAQGEARAGAGARDGVSAGAGVILIIGIEAGVRGRAGEGGGEGTGEVAEEGAGAVAEAGAGANWPMVIL